MKFQDEKIQGLFDFLKEQLDRSPLSYDRGDYAEGKEAAYRTCLQAIINNFVWKIEEEKE